jgi:hypothetical protein
VTFLMKKAFPFGLGPLVRFKPISNSQWSLITLGAMQAAPLAGCEFFALSSIFTSCAGASGNTLCFCHDSRSMCVQRERVRVGGARWRLWLWSDGGGVCGGVRRYKWKSPQCSLSIGRQSFYCVLSDLSSFRWCIKYDSQSTFGRFQAKNMPKIPHPHPNALQAWSRLSSQTSACVLKITAHTSPPLGPAVNNKPFWAESRRFWHFFDALPRTETESRCCSNFFDGETH